MSEGMLVELRASEPHSASSASPNPSLSSSSSTINRPVYPSGNSSTRPSPSVSAGMVGSCGSGSGPPTQNRALPTKTVSGPSQ